MLAVIRGLGSAGTVIQDARARGPVQRVINLLALAGGLSLWLVV
jgi:hypothetical protein